MTPSEALLAFQTVAAIALIYPAWLLMLSARGSLRRALYRRAIRRQEQPSVTRGPALSQALVAATTTPPAAPLPNNYSLVLEQCLEAYAKNKQRSAIAIRRELLKLSDQERRTLASRLDDARSKIELAMTEVLVDRMVSGSPHGSKVLLVPALRDSAISGSHYYLSDFLREVHRSLPERAD